jgi:hypothetical protein
MRGRVLLQSVTFGRNDSIGWNDLARRTPALPEGDPGLGKSLLALDRCSGVTTSRPWPDATPGLAAPPSSVFMATAATAEVNGKQVGAASVVRPNAPVKDGRLRPGRPRPSGAARTAQCGPSSLAPQARRSANTAVTSPSVMLEMSGKSSPETGRDPRDPRVL